MTEINRDLKQKFKIRLLGERILVQPIEKSKYGDFALVHGRRMPNAIVVAVGPGYLRETEEENKNNKEKWTPLDVKVGDEILCFPNGGVNVDINNVEYKILKECEVLAILDPEKGEEILEIKSEDDTGGFLTK